jgi:hypothetical protein
MSTDAIGRAIHDVRLEQALDVSQSRTYDCALDILRAYKLSGNFPINLQIVIKDLGDLADIAFVIEPKRFYSDRRRVVFRPRDNVDADTFGAMMCSIRDRIGFEVRQPRWISWGQTSIIQRTFMLLYEIAVRRRSNLMPARAHQVH